MSASLGDVGRTSPRLADMIGLTDPKVWLSGRGALADRGKRWNSRSSPMLALACTGPSLDTGGPYRRPQTVRYGSSTQSRSSSDLVRIAVGPVFVRTNVR